MATLLDRVDDDSRTPAPSLWGVGALIKGVRPGRKLHMVSLVLKMRTSLDDDVAPHGGCSDCVAWGRPAIGVEA